MILTEKAKEDFGLWHFERNTPIEEYKNFYDLSKTCKNALIIEWFDSVGINILLTCEFDYGYEILDNRYEVMECVKKWYDTRQQATEEAIKKACKIYENNRICNVKRKKNNKN